MRDDLYIDPTAHQFGYADPQTEVGGSSLREVIVPELAKMNADPQFEAVEISLEEFERD